MESLDPYDAFVTFFQEMNGRAMTEDEDNVIRTVINGEKEVAERVSRERKRPRAVRMREKMSLILPGNSRGFF